MDIQQLKLRGFTGIKKGLGRDEVELDFSECDGLIALSGPTGSGKTTIMENLQPFPMLISRPEKALKNHVFMRDSTKELSFTYNENVYKTLVKIDAESGRAEGFVWRNGASLVNGKISEYTRFIAELFGSPNLFFNSVFCAQNSTKISGLRPAELKALFAEFLGARLQKLTEQEITAKECMLSLTAKTSSLDESIQRYREAAEKETLLKDEFMRKSFTIISAGKKLEKSKESLDQQQKNLTAGKIRLAESEQIQQRITDVKNNLEKANEDMEETGRLAERELSVIQEKTDAAQVKIDEVKSLLANRTEIIKAKEDADNLAEKIIEADKNMAVINDEIQVKTREVYDAEIQHRNETADAKAEIIKTDQAVIDTEAKKIAAEDALQQTKKDIKALKSDSELASINFEINNLRSKIADLGKRDPECSSTTCSFIVGALKAQNSLPVAKQRRYAKIDEINEIKKDLQDKAYSQIADTNGILFDIEMIKKMATNLTETSRQEYLDRVAEIRKVGDALQIFTNKANGMSKAKDELRDAFNTAEKTARKAPDILVAEEREATLLANIKELLKATAEKKQASELAGLQKHTHIKKLTADATALQEQIDEDLPGEIEEVENSITQLSGDVAESEKSLTEIKAEVTIIERSLEVSQKAAEEKKILEAKKDRLIKESSEWAYLKDACGANGLRALEIDSIAPSITHDANMLLERAFGAWAMVDFRTQNDDGKEVLEPRVIDQDGDSVLIGNRSGGQQVWALKALRLAMTMISKKRSGKNLETLFCDEDDAGLDIETAQSFTLLYRAIMDMGGFKKCFFISHKPSCVDLADHVVSLSADKGTAIQ